jgi:hypothetical protein
MNEFEILNLKKINVKINDLLLDPNNPRFSKHQDEITRDDKLDDEEIQEYTFNEMLKPTNNFEILELASSIKMKGFVPVDNIFVRKINGKYLVVEGNRRITAIKLTLQKHKESKKGDVLPEDILETLSPIDCFDLSDNSSDEIDFVLGLRHHGSIMPWRLLPASFNIYKRYMQELCNEKGCENVLGNFIYEPRIAKMIKELYSLNLAEVRDKLRTYRAYLQLKEITFDPDLTKKFSIIGDSIKNKTLRSWFEFDIDKCIFSEEGAEKFISLTCVKEGNEPIITAAAAGSGENLRDLAYVIDKGTDQDEIAIIDNREAPSVVKSRVQTENSKINLISSLTLVLKTLKKIEIGDIEDKGLAESEKEMLDQIQEEISKLNKHR